MTTIYSFDESETAISSTSATPMTAADRSIIYADGPGRTRKATLGSMSALGTVTLATSATTATNITNFGFTSLGSSSGPITAWMLDPPFQSGVMKTILSLSTSTAHTVTVSTTGTNVTIFSTVSSIGRTVTFSAPGAYVELQSLSTAVWAMVGRATAGIVCT